MVSRVAQCASVLVACLAVASAAARGANACSKPMTLSTGQWEPYGYYDAQRRFIGIDADMVRAIFKEAGCVLVELPSMPPERGLLLFERGQIDVMSGASQTAGRRKFAQFTLPYRRETVGLFALSGKFDKFEQLRSFEDFLAQPHALLAPKAGWYGQAYEEQVPALRRKRRLWQFVDFAQGMRMLAAGRAPFILGDGAAVEHAAVREGVSVRPLPFWLVNDEVHLMFHRASATKADLHRINTAIERLRRQGALERIARSYGGH